MRVVFSAHAFRRMVERSISPDVVKAALATGEPVVEYPDDKPLPSRLILAWNGSQPLHLVSALDTFTEEEYIITVYEPDPALWSDDFTRRRKE